MRLRHLVPTLGLVATAFSAQAVETAPGLNIGGFVDTRLSLVDDENDYTTAGIDSVYGAFNTDGDMVIGFDAYAQIQVGYAISPEVAVQVDLEFWADPEDGSDNVNLQQAFVAYGINENVTFSMGKKEALIGYEAVDSVDRYRVNTSLVYRVNGVDPIGAFVNFKQDELSITGYLVNGVYADDQDETDSFGLGARAEYATEDFVLAADLGADLAQDDGTGDTETAIGFNLSGDYSGVENLVAFGDFAYRSFDSESGMALMVGANYAFNETMSATGMLSWIDMADLGESGEGDIEFAVALLTQPTDNENFKLNAELAFLTPDEGEDAMGVFVQMIGIIP